MNWPFALIAVGCSVLAPFHYRPRLAEHLGLPSRAWLVGWTLRGVAAPTVVFVLLNCGVLPGLPFLMPQIELARARGGSLAIELGRTLALGVFVIASYWGAFTLGWWGSRLARRVPDAARREFWVLVGCWSLLLGPIILATLYFTQGAGTGFAVFLWLLAITHFGLPLVAPRKLPPLYARAVGRMKLGKYAEAEQAVLEELERCEDDFEGWMLLAELYARHFRDLPEADRTVRELCAQPNVAPLQVSLALNRLADWHLQLADDPLAARRALTELLRRLPGTHFARLAAQRIAQLPESREDWLEQRQVKAVPLPALRADLEDSPLDLAPKLDPAAAAAEANRCVEKLRRDPNDAPPRERLARLLAEHLSQAEAGIQQLELLLGMDGQPENKRAEWLTMVGAWHQQYRGDRAAARAAFERLIREFPSSPQALAARRRLEWLEAEPHPTTPPT
jgi:hypothetical protein